MDRGFDFLREQGETFEYLDLSKLEMSSPDSCVIGQRHGLYGNYFDGIRFLGLSNEEARDLGFAVDPTIRSPEEQEAAWDGLGEAWREKIEEFRRNREE